MISAAPSWSRTRVASLHDLGCRAAIRTRRPPVRRAPAAAATLRSAGWVQCRGAEHQLDRWRRRLTTRSCQPVLALHRLMDRQHVEILVGENHRSAPRARRRCCHARRYCARLDSVDRPASVAQHRIDLDEMDVAAPGRAVAAPGAPATHPPSWCRGPVRARSAAASAANRSAFQIEAAHNPSSSPNIWLTSGAVVKSPSRPSGSRDT